jgi:hypothetical protein
MPLTFSIFDWGLRIVAKTINAYRAWRMRFVLAALPLNACNNLLAAVVVLNGEYLNITPRVHGYYSLAMVPTLSELRQWLPDGAIALFLTFLHDEGQMLAAIYLPSGMMFSEHGLVDMAFDSIAESDLRFVRPQNVKEVAARLIRELPEEDETTNGNN